MPERRKSTAPRKSRSSHLKWLIIIPLLIALVLAIVIPSLRSIGGRGIGGAREEAHALDLFKNLERFQDYDYDMEKAFHLSATRLPGTVTAQYLDLQSRYDQALSAWLEGQLGIASLDADLASRKVAGYRRLPLQRVRKDGSHETYFRSKSHLLSPYLYLRSNIRLERLSPADLATLKNNTMDQADGRKILISLAGRTFRDTTHYESLRRYKFPITDLAYNWTSRCCAADPKSYSSNFAPARSLVFWLSYTDSENAEGWNEYQYVKEAAARSEKAYSAVLGYPARIFVHPMGADGQAHPAF